jgi:hypothetical protein
MINEIIPFEAPYVSISYQAEDRYIKIIWKKFAVDSEQSLFREKLLEMIKQSGSNTYLTDNTRLAGTTEKMQTWIRDVWFPLAFEAGLRNVVAVQSNDKFAEFAVENILKGSTFKKMNYKFFKTIEEAEMWIKEFTGK